MLSANSPVRDSFARKSSQGFLLYQQLLLLILKNEHPSSMQKICYELNIYAIRIKEEGREWMTMSINISEKISEAFNAFNTIKNEKRIAIAYSGGKDSTTTAILFYQWLLKNNIKNKEIIVIHEDTQSEFDILERWARKFIDEYCKKIEETGNVCKKLIVTPRQNFYASVIIFGYPAPTRNFRWCVNHLKIKPNNLAIKSLGRLVLITGHREDESSARALIIKNYSSSSCALAQSCSSSFFLNVQIEHGMKLIPLRNWTLEDVWQFLATVKDFDIKDLFKLYYEKTARFGCWHCTLVRINKPIFYMEQMYLYLEALRIIYKTISELQEEFRVKKVVGDKYGPLNTAGRAIMFRLFPVVEEKSGYRMYGLDEYRVESYTLRQLFYEIDAKKADEIILRNFRFFDNRFISIKTLREYKIEKEKIEKISKAAKNIDAYKSLLLYGNFVEELLDSLRK